MKFTIEELDERTRISEGIDLKDTTLGSSDHGPPYSAAHWTSLDAEKADKELVSLMKKEYPKTISAFKQIQKEQFMLFCRKQHDYGPHNISVGTNLESVKDIKMSLTGLWFRMNDKIQRAKTLLMSDRQVAVKDEPLEDSFLDVSNYGIMATIVKRGHWGK